MKLKTMSVVSSLAVMAAMAAPAYAQDDTAAQGDGRNPDIIVTAQFVETKLQDTPIAITAVNAEMLEARGQTDTAQIAAQAPNVTLKPQGQGAGNGLIAYIRGVGQTDFIYARDPGVGVYIDDVYIPTLQSSLMELMDLDRVEILRGPQGTLAGKNSIGGAIKLFGKKPKGDGSGSVEVSYGSFNDLKVRGYADFKITDTLNARVSGLARSTDGYVKLIDYGLTHPTSNVPANGSIGRAPENGTMGGRKVVATRLALDWQPVDKLNVYLTADYTSQTGDPGAAVLIAAGKAGVPFDPTSQNPAVDTGGTGTPWLEGTDGNPVTIGCQFVPNGPYSCDTPPSGYNAGYISYANYMDAMAPTPTAPFKPYYAIPTNTFKGWGVHGTVTYDAADALQIVWISSYRKYTSTWAEDQDLTPVGESQLNNINRHHAFSQELRFNFNLADGLIDGTVGGFYFSQYGEYEARVDLNYVAAGPPFAAAPIDFIHGPDRTPSRSKAVFANINIHPTDAFTITGGIRYSKESKAYTYFRRNPDYTAPDAATCALPGFVGLRMTSNCALVGFLGYSPPPFKGNRLDWRVVANYRFSDALMAYASVSTGFKGGGINPRPFVADQALPFDPETLTTYEAGFKADLFDRRVRFNGAAFYNKYNNIQGTKLVCPESVLAFPCLRPENVGSGEMKGVEFETHIYPADGLSFDGSLAYIDFKFTGPFDTVTGTLANTSIPIGATTPYTPKWSWSLGAQYDYSFDSGAQLSFRLDGSYQGKLYTTSENTPFSLVDDYFLANGRLAFTTADDGWQIYGEVKNIFDKYYFNSISDASNSLGVVTGQPGLPRTFTIGIKKNFH